MADNGIEDALFATSWETQTIIQENELQKGKTTYMRVVEKQQSIDKVEERKMIKVGKR